MYIMRSMVIRTSGTIEALLLSSALLLILAYIHHFNLVLGMSTPLFIESWNFQQTTSI